MSEGALVDKFFKVIRNGDATLVQGLLEQSPSFAQCKNKKGQTAVLHAIECAEYEIAQLLISKGADPNAADNTKTTPLIAAICGGHDEAVSSLLAVKSVKADVADADGYTPLHWAVRLGNESAVNALLERKANPNAATTKSKVAPVHSAAAEGFLAAIRSLASAGADVAAVDADGNSALQYAVTNNRPECVVALLDLGCKPRGDECLLHAAVQDGNAAVVRALVDRGVPTDTADAAGHSALDLAEARAAAFPSSSDARSICDALVSAGARTRKAYEVPQAQEQKQQQAGVDRRERGAAAQNSKDGGDAEKEKAARAGAARQLHERGGPRVAKSRAKADHDRGSRTVTYVVLAIVVALFAAMLAAVFLPATNK